MSAEAERERSRENARFYHRLSVCTRCKTRDARTSAGRWLCAECAEKKAAYLKAYAQAHGDEIRAAHKQQRQKRRAAGLCTKCGGEREEARYVTCAQCRARTRNEYQSSRRRTNINLPRGKNGLCYWCNRAPAEEGHRLCPACMEKARANTAKASAARQKKRKERTQDAGA